MNNRQRANLINLNYGMYDESNDGRVCPDRPLPSPSNVSITLENLPEKPALTSGKLYQFNGELYFGDLPIDNNFIFDQALPQSMWYITHGLNKFPSVTIVDSSGRVVAGGDIVYTNTNSLTIEFGSAFSGKAYLN